jgi:hypothetical protein
MGGAFFSWKRGESEKIAACGLAFVHTGFVDSGSCSAPATLGLALAGGAMLLVVTHEIIPNCDVMVRQAGQPEAVHRILFDDGVGYGVGLNLIRLRRSSG